MRPAKELARHLQPPLTSERLERQWNGVVRLDARKSRKRWTSVGAGVALAAVVALLIVLLRPSLAPVAPLATEGTVVETSGANAQPLLLADGSRVEVARASRLTLEHAGATDVHLILSNGGASFDVTHVPGRPFTVSAGGFDVRVRGTKFRVDFVPLTALAVPASSSSRRVRVSVTEGRVEVLHSGSTSVERAVSAGESWTSNATDARSPVTSNAAPSNETSPSAAPSNAAPSEAPASARANDAVSAPEDPGHRREPRDEPDARKLLEIADSARLAGHPAEAAQALDKLRLTHRADPRASLAALELGRLRMDALGDPRGALQAFDDAIQLGKNGAIRDDAEARRVQALDVLGDVAGCQRARDAYLRTYPKGIHAAAVRGRCVAK